MTIRKIFYLLISGIAFLLFADIAGSLIYRNVFYDEVSGVVKINDLRYAYIAYRDPIDGSKFLRVSHSIKTHFYEVGEKVDLLVAPNDQIYDRPEATIKNKSNPLIIFLFFTICIFARMAFHDEFDLKNEKLKIGDGNKSGPARKSSPSAWELARRKRVRNSIDVEIAEKMAELKSRKNGGHDHTNSNSE